MANTVKIKRSSVQGKDPTTGDLELGELALNTYDGNLFFKRDVSGSESVVKVATNTNLLSFTNVTTDITAVSRQSYIADTSSAAFTITLPASPNSGDWVTIADGASFQTNPLIVARNSSTIVGVEEDLSLNIEGVSVTLVYDGSTWEVFTQVGARGGDSGAGDITASSSTTFTNKTISGSTNTLSNIPNSALTNSYITINGTAISLGDTASLTADANSLTGTTLKSNVVSSSLTSVGTLTNLAVTNTITGSVSGNAGTVTNGVYTTDTGTVTNTMLAGSISNSKLSNSSVTIGSTSVSLGATATSFTGLSSVTSTSFVGALTGNASTATTLTTARAIYGNNFDGSAALTQVIASTYGGTGNGFTKFTGPTSSEKTFTLPDASSTIVVQGGALGTPTSGNFSSGTFTWPTFNQSTTGSAATLTTSRNINGVAFNGSAAITIKASTTNALTIGTGLSGTSFDGGTAVTIAIDSTVATLTGTQTLTNKTLTSPTIGGTVPSLTIAGAASVTANASTDKYLNIGTHGQLFDDGNFHVHTNSGALWLNSLDGGSINLGLQSNTGSSDVNAHGTFSMDSGYGSIAPVYGVRAWISCGYVGGNMVTNGSGNLSVSRTTAGKYVFTFGTSMPDGNYCVTATSKTPVDNSDVSTNLGYNIATTTTGFTIHCARYGTGFVDVPQLCVQVVR
jgi:hypothetical protein